MLVKLRNLFRDESGQDIIEYGLLASFISIVAVAVIQLIGVLVVPLYDAVANALSFIRIGNYESMVLSGCHGEGTFILCICQMIGLT